MHGCLAYQNTSMGSGPRVCLIQVDVTTTVLGAAREVYPIILFNTVLITYIAML